MAKFKLFDTEIFQIALECNHALIGSQPRFDPGSSWPLNILKRLWNRGEAK